MTLSSGNDVVPLHHVGYVVRSIEEVAEGFARSIGASWDQKVTGSAAGCKERLLLEFLRLAPFDRDTTLMPQVVRGVGPVVQLEGS